jgi:hypothetical protein
VREARRRIWESGIVPRWCAGWATWAGREVREHTRSIGGWQKSEKKQQLLALRRVTELTTKATLAARLYG